MNEDFRYDPELPRDINFRRWYEANTLEREIYGLPKYSQSEALDLFDKLYDLFDKTPNSR
jgi:hypothetical protein